MAVPAGASAGTGIGFTQGALGIFAAAIGAVASGVALGPMKTRLQDTKINKNYRNANRLRRHPSPLLTEKELRKRTFKVQLLRRKDIAACEDAWNYDPREAKYQMDVQEVKRIVETPGYVSVEQEREALGAPMPPFSLMDDALSLIRQERLTGSRREKQPKQEGEGGDDAKARPAQKGKKGVRTTGGVDLSTMDMDFVDFKGIQMTKKELARLQGAGIMTRNQRKAANKKK